MTIRGTRVAAVVHLLSAQIIQGFVDKMSTSHGVSVHWQFKCLFKSLSTQQERKHDSLALLTLVGTIHRWPLTGASNHYSTVYSDADQRKHQSSESLAFVRGIHRGPVNSPHKWSVTRKMFPFDDVIMMHAESVSMSWRHHDLSMGMQRFSISRMYYVLTRGVGLQVLAEGTSLNHKPSAESAVVDIM